MDEALQTSSILGSMERLLVIAPHPDDEVIGAGGLMSRSRRHGCEVAVFLGNVRSEERLNESIAGCDLLGVTNIFQSEQGGRVGSLERDLVAELDSLLNLFKPNLLLVPANAVHPEHQMWHRVAIASARPKGGTLSWRPNHVWCWEAPADQWGQVAQPNTFVKLDPVDLDAKLSALEAHESQKRSAPSERSGYALRALAQLRGTQCGSDLAEAYESIHGVF
jgi:LmbE family N-acetylglucosaminyl deacetylase